MPSRILGDYSEAVVVDIWALLGKSPKIHYEIGVSLSDGRKRFAKFAAAYSLVGLASRARNRFLAHF